jgi:hypothetical protein
VLNFEYDGLSARFRADVHATTGWRLGDGVVDQVVQEPCRQPDVGLDDGARRGVAGEGYSPTVRVSGGLSSAPARPSSTANSSSDPTNQEAISKSRDTPIHRS